MNTPNPVLLVTLAGTLCLAAGFSGSGGESVSNGVYSVDVPNYASDDPYRDLQDTLTLQGTVRDFREWSDSSGHIDFEAKPGSGFGHYVNMVADDLGPDGLPVFYSLGNKVSSQARDAAGRGIIGDKPYIESKPGDTDRVVQGAEGAFTGEASGGGIDEFSGLYDQGAVYSAQSFNMWFRDIPGVNLGSSFPTTLVRQPGTDLYVFDDKDVGYFQSIGGFFIINNEGYGNSAGENKNFHFTYQLSTEFLYKKGAGQTFRFIGDDDVWVFIDGKLVIDLGGIHAAVDQTIEMDRITTLVHGRMHRLDFFFAERHRTQSNFRVETNLVLKREAKLPAGNNLYD